VVDRGAFGRVLPGCKPACGSHRFRRWFQEVVSGGGFRRWFQEVVSGGGFRRWFQEVGAGGPVYTGDAGQWRYGGMLHPEQDAVNKISIIFLTRYLTRYFTRYFECGGPAHGLGFAGLLRGAACHGWPRR
jgi:hypothetical protein